VSAVKYVQTVQRQMMDGAATATPAVPVQQSASAVTAVNFVLMRARTALSSV